ncbi:hypothetical protein CFC21_101303 [Triticum aestivum]|uniref:Uncharacterized protein n=2 Tax=Triticum aestivum TaxID=4565 RepID=A0A9R1N3W3_WHEAT|nr:uncharacterized protein At5g41620-like [Triticum dicoccoides]XP_044429810.1 uncharacterized protein At5g41620-like [Triticum aestivum]XP_044429811.1 uncharacterized protein At5g41620-like [Triticum aestivum]KAF7099700.1 hypothetical protein CFC21_101303 [Triticum aestivum]
MLRRRDAGEAVAAVEEVTTRPKIRKRCALSSSSGASGTLRRLRLRRGVVSLHRRGSGGVASPLPTSWKMSESSWSRACRADGMHSSVSARKLVSALWQMNEGGLLEEEEEARIARDAAARRGSAAAHRRSASSVEISKRSRTRSKVVSEADHGRHWFSDKLSNAGTTGMQACAQDSSSTCSADRMAHLQDMYNSLTACKELVRVLGNIWGPGDLSPSTASLLSALRSELDLARAHARQLARERSHRGSETVELMKKRLEAEARAWKSKQREKVAATVRVVCDELDGERRSRRRAERVSAKLGSALAEAERELERERRSRERLEKVCDELVRGGEVEEEVRREAEEAQAEVDREREMLRLADELREERVQMKLLEARLQFEEKNAVVEQLRGELEAFLETKKQGLLELESPAAADEERQATHDDDDHHGFFEAEGGNGVARVDVNKRTDVDDDGGGSGDDSDGSDMHSIELNMDGGRNKDYGGWSYTTAFKEMMTTTAKKAASADSRGTGCADLWAGDRRSLEEPEGGQRWDDDEGRSDVDEEDSERYQAIKNLREQMLAGHGLGSIFLSGAYEGNYTA